MTNNGQSLQLISRDVFSFHSPTATTHTVFVKAHTYKTSRRYSEPNRNGNSNKNVTYKYAFMLF